MHIIECVHRHRKKDVRKRMGWRGRGGGWGRWPGRGLYGYGRGFGYGLGYGRGSGYGYGGFGYGRGMGYGRGYGRGYGYYGAGYGRGYGPASPYNCARFPGLPRWWWADPKYGSSLPYPPTPDTSAELDRLQAERVALEGNIEEMKRHVEEGTTPSTWPTQPFPYYGTGAYAPSPEQEKKILEEQMTAISSEMEAIKKRLEEIVE